MEPRPGAQPQTVGIRELKQNPSDIIARAASGTRFDVLSNGKPVGVVIQREATVRRRWVTSEALVALTKAALVGQATDTTGWADELRAQREAELDQGNDPIIDPWESRSAPADEGQAGR